MPKKFINPIRFQRIKKLNDMKNQDGYFDNNSDRAKQEDKSDDPIPKTIKAISEKLSMEFAECSDFVKREINWGHEEQPWIIIAYISNLVNLDLINRDVVNPLQNLKYDQELPITRLAKETINATGISDVEKFQDTISDILSGNTVIYIDCSKTALTVNLREAIGRAVGEPDTEVTIRGPREGFVERMATNIALLRRKIRSVNFKVETMRIGEKTKTDVAICYIKGVAHPEIVETVRRRLNRIKTDAILESGYLEQFIEDVPYSPLPTIGNSEKPDKVAAKVLEGRVAIVCDGTPFVLTAPYLLVETIQAGEDYYEKPYFSSVARILRLLAVFISGNLPGIYVALLTFHQNIVPLKLLLTISSSREGIPFSAFLEALLMTVVWEFLREAGARMPRTIAQTIGIVGGIVLGEAAVRAGIASAPMIIVIGLTGICSLIVPPLLRAATIIRIIILFAANILGLLGIATVIVAVFIHMCSLRSFGVPYLAPFSPFNGMDMKDTFVRFPLWTMVTRPRVLTWDNKGAQYRMKVDYRKKED